MRNLLYIRPAIFQFWKINALVYVVQISSAMLAYFFMVQVFEDALGHSIHYQSLMTGFDRTVIMDLIHNDALDSRSVLMFILLLGLIWVFISTYLTAGTIACLVQKKMSIRSFYLEAGRFFMPFLILNAIWIILLLIITLLLGFAASLWIGDPLETFDTEKPVVWIVIASLSIILILAVLIWLFIFRVKLYLIKNGVSIAQAYIRAHRSRSAFSFLRNIAIVIFYALLLRVVFALKSIDLYDQDSSSIYIVISIVFTHLLSYLIIYLRLWFFGCLIQSERAIV